MKRNLQSKIILFLALSMLLSGCDSVRDHLAQEMLKQSGVSDDISYIQYQKMEEAKALDKDGLYYSKELEEQMQALSAKPSGTVHISFARNDLLHIDYFLDDKLTDAIDVDNCWLNPGDEIYVRSNPGNGG